MADINHPVATGQTFKYRNQTRVVWNYKPGNKTITYLPLAFNSVEDTLSHHRSHWRSKPNRMDVADIGDTWFLNEYEVKQAYAEYIRYIVGVAGFAGALEEMLEDSRQEGYDAAREDYH